MMMIPRLFELLQAEIPSWLEVLAASTSIEDSQFVHPETNLTPLHLAVMTKDWKNNDSRLAVIRSLLQSDLTATEVCCYERGFTPLMHACLVVQGLDLKNLEHDVPVVKILMEYNPKAFRIRSPAGHSALDLHIISMSRWQQDVSSMRSSSFDIPSNGEKTTKSTPVLNALVEHDLGIALMTSLDLLIKCNTLEVMEHVAYEEAHALLERLKDRRRQRRHPNEELPMPSGTRNLQGFWVWEFLLSILRAEHQHTFQDVKPVPPFNALHMACQIDDFPLPFLMLCIRVYPTQVRMPSIVKSDLPVHSVATWQVPCESKGARKSMALALLLTENPTSSQRRNEDGKTPLSLAIESGTGWNNGVWRLTAAQKESSITLR